MMIRYLFILLVGFAVLPLTAQTNKEIRELEGRNANLRKEIAEADELLQSTRKTVAGQLNAINTLNGQIAQRKSYIQALQKDIATVDREMSELRKTLNQLQSELKDRQKLYEASALYLYRNRSIQDKLMFIFSAKNLNQSYRRMRYMREYSTYQRRQGEEVMKKQEQVRTKQAELAAVLATKQELLKSQEEEKKTLDGQEKERRALLATMQKRQKSLQAEVNKKKREQERLNARIDKLIAEEIERERKRAAEEARKLAEANKKKAAAGTKTTASTSTAASKPSTSGTASTASATTAAANTRLSTNFAQNRGKLQRPVLGTSVVVGHYGQYAVEGLRNVRLDNKGVDIQTKPGTQACAIFDGKVTGVFQLNGMFNVLVRHGSYVSVYCNLASVSVKNGDDVKTRQPLGVVYTNKADNNRTVLHFQLRKEKEKINPEPWFSK